MAGVRRPLNKTLQTYCTPDQWANIDRAVRQLVTAHPRTVVWKLQETLDKLAQIEMWENGRPAGRAGMARLGMIHQSLELHTEILPYAHPERQSDHDQTLMHEVGHFIAYFLFQDHGHGRVWKNVMAALGMPGHERCHSLAYLTGRPRIVTCRYVHGSTTGLALFTGRASTRSMVGALEFIRAQ